MTADEFREMWLRHWAHVGIDENVVHDDYHDDAVLEFPQSGERFVGVANFREWRSSYPASTKVEFREIRGRDDLWVAEVSISYDEGPWSLGVSILEFRGDKIARESIYVTEGWEAPPPTGGVLMLGAVAAPWTARRGEDVVRVLGSTALGVTRSAVEQLPGHEQRDTDRAVGQRPGRLNTRRRRVLRSVPRSRAGRARLLRAPHL